MLSHPRRRFRHSLEAGVEPGLRRKLSWGRSSFFVTCQAAKQPLEFVHFSGRSGGVDGAISRIQTEVGNQFGVFGNFFA